MIITQYLVIICLAVVAIVIQTTLFWSHPLLSQVDAIFVVVVILGLWKDPVHGSIKSVFLGYLQDLYYPAEVVGLFMASRVLLFSAAQIMKIRLSPERPGAQFIIAIVLGAFDKIFNLILLAIFSQPVAWTWSALVYILIGIFTNAAMVPLLYFLLCKVPGFIDLPKGPKITG
jgi:cell shape-determining protein MreD